ncbi:MlaD family protein [Bradyrhizobium sp.]|jgi:phospholipid/cholesterol/gamma-HCH transport system substrate-binding protein|uniref:MlaD family protein n=1 Tax=Bradyrhizobium sp. TaxID=376 RepID=UPI002D745FEE|nr:MlaD family protein [Bradyrhizobium sp.]HZR74089.1 MlaD family protein [Bradyrhizobium sp.]
MKIRATNLVIGTATLAILAVAFFGILGVRKYRAVSQETRMRIVFEGGSASGLRRGGSVNFDGVQVGEVLSLRLDTPRKVVAEVRVDRSAPIRKDTVAGLEFQGLTGIAAISLIGGESPDPPAPSGKDGIPTLVADLSELHSMRDTLHNVDRILVDNRTTIKDGLLSFETYTASLAGSGDAIDQALAKANAAFAGFDGAIARIDNLLPGFTDGKADELFEKMQAIREFAQTFDKKSSVVMEEARQTLVDVSEGANKITAKFNPQAVAPARPPRRQAPQR